MSGAKVIVLGAGKSGLAAVALLQWQGYEAKVLDEDEVFPEKCRGRGDRNVATPIGGASGCGDRNVATPIGGATGCAANGEATFLSPQGAEEIPFAVVSPGIPLTHSWVVEAKRRGIPLKSELQFGCEELKRRGWRLLAVTGSKGKSSVVKLVAEAIGGVACGNYGLPVCEVALPGCGDRNVAAPTGGVVGCGDKNVAAPTGGVVGCGDKNVAAPIGGAVGCGDKNVAAPAGGATGCAANGVATFLSPRWAVVEVSSFMLETTNLPPDTFEAAAILNLQEDHLDRHGSVEVYHGLKRRLLDMTRRPIVGAELGAADDALMAGSYFDNGVLRENGRCAIALMRAAGLDDDVISKAFHAFEPLPHRMNLVAEIAGVRYIDDSKATSLAALAAGVEMAFAQCQSPITNHQAPGTRHQAPGTRHQAPGTRHQAPVLLIAGGLPKGDDPKIALPILTKRVKKVYLIGQCAELFLAAWKSAVDCEVSGTMERAVEHAKRSAAKGDVVLLSPGTASFDQFKSFGERGEVFARLVQKGKKE